jgi:hypothetical protein
MVVRLHAVGGGFRSGGIEYAGCQQNLETGA